MKILLYTAIILCYLGRNFFERMKMKRFARMVVSAACVVTLAACGGGGSGGGGGSHADNADGSAENAPGEDNSGETPSQPGGAVHQLLPDNVTSAELEIRGSNGIVFNLRLTDVAHIGNIWQASVSGHATLPTEDLGFDPDLTPPYESFTVIECKIQQSNSDSITLSTVDSSSPMTENEVAVEIRKLRINLKNLGPNNRSGFIEEGEVWVRAKADPLSQDIPLNLTDYLNGATVELKNYTRSN